MMMLGEICDILKDIQCKTCTIVIWTTKVKLFTLESFYFILGNHV